VSFAGRQKLSGVDIAIVRWTLLVTIWSSFAGRQKLSGVDIAIGRCHC
jgi:hypothetical protein